MDVTFIYNGVKITTPNLEKKLKRMKLTIDDITIVEDTKENKQKDEESNKQIIIYHFTNGKSSIYSINKECPDGYSFVDYNVYYV